MNHSNNGSNHLPFSTICVLIIGLSILYHHVILELKVYDCVSQPMKLVNYAKTR